MINIRDAGLFTAADGYLSPPTVIDRDKPPAKKLRHALSHRLMTGLGIFAEREVFDERNIYRIGKIGAGRRAATCDKTKVLLDTPMLPCAHGGFDDAPEVRHLAV